MQIPGLERVLSLQLLQAEDAVDAPEVPGGIKQLEQGLSRSFLSSETLLSLLQGAACLAIKGLLYAKGIKGSESGSNLGHEQAWIF